MFGDRYEFSDGILDTMDSLPVQIRDLVPKRFQPRTVNHAQRELLKPVDVTLAIFNRRLHLLESDESKQLSDIFNPDETISELLNAFCFDNGIG